MPRTKPELLKSKERLSAAIEALREEVRAIDSELMGYKKGVPLNERYFRQSIAPLLSKHENGMTSAELQAELEMTGDRINTVSLRTFLSRYGAKGKLIKVEKYSPPRWRVSTSS